LTLDELRRRRAMPGGPGALYLSHFATCRGASTR
jgi:hypothetical protein